MTAVKTGILFVVSAPSGAGKTTLCEALLAADLGLAYSVSTTTRKPRPGEKDGVHYHFVSDEEFRRLREAGEFAECAEVHGHWYGTRRSVIEEARTKGRDLLFDIDVQGARQLRRSFPDGVFIFIYPPSMASLEERLRRRKTETAEDLARRLANARVEIREAWAYDYVVVNDDLDRAIEKFRSIVRAEALRTSRFAPPF
jgi:guanylate kinase